MSFTLRPRFLPDRDVPQEWGTKGFFLVRMIRLGLRVPPVAALGSTEIADWLETRSQAMPDHWPASVETLTELLVGGAKWPLILRPSYPRGSSWSGQLKSVVVEVPTSESVWEGFLRVTQPIREQTQYTRPLPSVLVQPVLEGIYSGTVSSAAFNGQLPPEVPQSEILETLQRMKSALKADVEMDWCWDGEQLWWLEARSNASTEKLTGVVIWAALKLWFQGQGDKRTT